MTLGVVIAIVGVVLTLFVIVFGPGVFWKVIDNRKKNREEEEEILRRINETSKDLEWIQQKFRGR